MPDYDAIVVGAGPNGLSAAVELARNGCSVLVIEANDTLGGGVRSGELTLPGFVHDICSTALPMGPGSPAFNRLPLREHGLVVLPATDLFCPLDERDYIIFSEDKQKTVSEFSRFSKKDADIYPAFAVHLEEAAAIVRQLLLETPIDPMRRDWRSFKNTARLLWKYRKIGSRFYRVIDLMTMSAYDYLSRWFESDVIKAIFAYYGSIGTYAGPKSPGSAYVIMHHLMGEHEGAGGWGPGLMAGPASAFRGAGRPTRGGRSGRTHGAKSGLPGSRRRVPSTSTAR
jgi:phytoene dehydrogenase-like protein